MTDSYTVTNPFDNSVLSSHLYDSWDVVEAKLQLLKSGQKTQKKFTAFERSDILRNLAGLLSDNAEELAKLITLETGKTISDSRVEMSRAVNAAKSSSEEARQISGECLDSDAFPPARGKIGISLWKPLGTILCITPFNFPINIAMHKIGPAFAAGNAILFKASPVNTQSSMLFTQLCYQAGIPEDVLQFAMPADKDLNKLNSHDLVDGINFTGGTNAANAISAVSGYKKLLLELGGNDPLIVLPDGDIEAAVNASINQRLATAGQRCTAAKRIFLHEDIYDAFRDLLLEKTQKLVVGDPMKEDTFIGPVISKKAAESIQYFIEDAIFHGATVTAGNKFDGAIVYPTILENLSVDCLLMKEEVFGPVLPLTKFNDIEEIIPIINNSPYGLQAGVFTQNLAIARTLFEELDVGTLACNDGPGFRTEHFPFGGVKQSGAGREGIKYAIREMSYLKTLVI
ncbi:aldehyde dehydrogenase family protein [Spongiibacter sp. KMU-158]|uniref:Aldehyde dehydrogenase family protein n=1 Tax=Spongiibacter pelagi TaxID=2760804 RepID=A0A927BYK6_9GAMM|nr:aldehyde dehydrogenase family protein [Spongiibacter pelagi]MBD2857939.1 aldehyde dehydrogenase family protein [Spongiibacter pelagi]